MKIDCKHEKVKCERCGNGFECKVGSINLCQCREVILSDEQRTYIKYRYDDCLCADCLKELRSEYNITRFNEQIGNLMMKLGRR